MTASPAQTDMPFEDSSRETEVKPDQPRLSLVFPIFDEAPNIEPLLCAARDIAQRLTPDFEILVVADGSRDRSAEILERIGEADPRGQRLRPACTT
ncbi:MAG: glycosyltransferase family 2 protein, partial [bacterium]